MNAEKDLFLCGVYIPPEKLFISKMKYLMNWKMTVSFASRRNVMILGDFNARTCKLEDFISNDGNNFINDTSENCLQAKHRQNFDIHIN